ncbi:putative toxin biosynthesis [Phaeomoniella chlamydospora]|uniref:Putative toxin biosynthesis n=1 Tax=Phaeomoniella chlamydospora TaxID=158046 RepID=A0A0G2EGH8_PHACM|nr:putative toxin biosynthesis [Phaeomoniella chlamydospora]
MSSVFRVVEHTLPSSHIREYPRALSGEQEDILQIAVKQYVPSDNPNPRPGDVTIIGAHANGFPKELYEPLWEELIKRSRKSKIRIRSIWLADVAWQGQSGVLNENKLGNDPSWMDHARDLFLMINLKRHEMPRPIVGIGHSMGANNLVNLAYIHPRLFTTLILIDPVILEFPTTPPEAGPATAQLSNFRREIWPSRSAAATSFQKSKFFQAWDPRVLERWIQFGLRDLPTLKHPSTSASPDKGAGVTLTTTRDQEVFTFARPNYSAYGLHPSNPPARETHADLDPKTPTIYPFYRPEGPNTFDQLPHLRPPVLYIFGETSAMSTPSLIESRLLITGTGVGGSGGRPLSRVQSTVIKDAGHLVAMEKVRETADEATKWLESELNSWKASEDQFRREWSATPENEKRYVDKKWNDMIRLSGDREATAKGVEVAIKNGKIRRDGGGGREGEGGSKL